MAKQSISDIRNKRMMAYAEENNDVAMMKIACGQGSIWDYLAKYIEENDLTEWKVNEFYKRTLGTTFKSNATRRKRLEKWIRHEEDDMVINNTQKAIIDLYKQEANLLDDYAFLIADDLLGFPAEESK